LIATKSSKLHTPYTVYVNYGMVSQTAYGIFFPHRGTKDTEESKYPKIPL